MTKYWNSLKAISDLKLFYNLKTLTTSLAKTDLFLFHSFVAMPLFRARNGLERSLELHKKCFLFKKTSFFLNSRNYFSIQTHFGPNWLLILRVALCAKHCLISHPKCVYMYLRERLSAALVKKSAAIVSCNFFRQ